MVFSDTRDPSDEGRQRQIHYQSAASMEQYLAHKLPGAQPFVETGNIIAYDDPAWAESESSDFHHLAADLTAAWDSSKVRRYRRQLAFVEGRHLVVVDEIECTDPAIRVRWLLHSAVEPHRLADDADAAWEVRLTNSLLYARMLLPERPKATLIGGAGHEFEVNGINYAMIGRNGKEVKPFPEAGAWRLELETATPTAKRLFVAVLTACDTALPPPKLAAHREGKALVVAIDGRETRFLKIEE